MSIKLDLLNGALSAIADFHPEYKPFIDWFKAHEDACLRILGAISTALANGAAATSAVRREAPELADAIHEVAASQSPLPSRRDQINEENITRTVFGFPKMTPAEESAWMNSATPNLPAGGGA